MRVVTCSGRNVPVADALPNACPRDTLLVKQANAPVPEVVGGEGRDTGSATGTGDGGAESVCSESLEHPPSRAAILACEKAADGLEQDGWYLHPPCPSRLGDGL